jgi:hypothetical protein
MSAYPPPTENLPIFDSSQFSTLTGTLTKAEADLLYLHYPLGQGNETIPSLVVSGAETIGGQLNAEQNIVMSGTANTNYIEFPDVTKQYTAYILPSPAPTAGSYTNANITINSAGQITSASNGSGGVTSFTISSNAVGTNSWDFTIPNSYGRAFTYSVYSDTSPTTETKTVSSPFTYGTPTLNGSFFFATGNAVNQPYGITSTIVDYCQGFPDTHDVSSNGAGYLLSVVNTMGQTITWTIGSSTATLVGCPETLTSMTTTYNLTIAGSVGSCYAKLVGIVVAS